MEKNIKDKTKNTFLGEDGSGWKETDEPAWQLPEEGSLTRQQ